MDKWPYNMGAGTPVERVAATIETAIRHPNAVTRWSARMTLAELLARLKR
jgi:hypothetical protein